jgi:hypothetical protein
MRQLITVRVTAKPRWIRLLWEPRDCWVGLYWTTTRGHWYTPRGEPGWHWDSEWHLYLCLVPCFPLHVRLPRAAKTSEEYYADDRALGEDEEPPERPRHGPPHHHEDAL